MPKALRKVASSTFAPAKTEPIWTLSEPGDKGVCKGGGSAPLPTPPLLVCAMQAVFQENRTINKNCVKHVVVMALF